MEPARKELSLALEYSEIGDDYIELILKSDFGLESGITGKTID